MGLASSGDRYRRILESQGIQFCKAPDRRDQAKRPEHVTDNKNDWLLVFTGSEVIADRDCPVHGLSPLTGGSRVGRDRENTWFGPDHMPADLPEVTLVNFRGPI